MGLYTGSLFILSAIIAYLFYTLSYSYHLDERRHAMQLAAHSLSSKIISAHMRRQPLDLEKLIRGYPYTISLVDKQGRRIAGKELADADLQKDFGTDGRWIRIVDKSSFGHLGVDAIVIEDGGFGAEIGKLRERIAAVLLFSYMVILAVGFFLAKLFIKPIQMRRKQLDNFIKESTHELNTPIAALLMSVDAKGAKADRNDERIKISARRISNIYKDLTYLFLRDKSDVRKESLDIRELLIEQVEALKPLAQKKGVVFQQHYHNALRFEIDHESAVRLITNLLSNAIKYNKRGGSIVITLYERELSIKDSGIGIAKEAQKEIFKRFFRATTQSGGFGLGLSIVSDICRRYAIEVTLDSVLDQGTTFRLIFP